MDALPLTIIGVVVVIRSHMRFLSPPSSVHPPPRGPSWVFAHSSAARTGLRCFCLSSGYFGYPGPIDLTSRNIDQHWSDRRDLLDPSLS
jgi:hypothetical protein